MCEMSYHLVLISLWRLHASAKGVNTVSFCIWPTMTAVRPSSRAFTASP